MGRHRWDPRAIPLRGLVRPVPVDPAGVAGPTEGQARGKQWRRTSRGLYVPAETSVELLEQRILEQAARLPKQGVVTGWAGCRLAGAAFFDGLDRDGVTKLPVPVNVGPRGQLRADRELRVCFHVLAESERRIRHGIRTVIDERATYDAMRLADDLVETVVAFDMMAAAELVSLRMMREWCAPRCTAREPFVPRALTLASERSWSPNETRLRMIWVLLALLPRPLVNCPVHDREGRLLGIVDLLDVVAGLAVEYDGAEHRRAVRQAKDVAKEERLRRVGLEVTRVTGPDLHDPDLVVARLLGARSRARFEPEGDRAWVARAPVADLHERILARREHEAWLERVDAKWRDDA